MTKPKKKTESPAPPKPKGFAAMTPQRRIEVARMGGTRAQQLGTAHRFTAETAKAAGQQGGRGKKKAR